jgi:hypothetical protein
MASSIEVTVTFGYDSRSVSELHEYLSSDLPMYVAPAQNGGPSGQQLVQVCGDYTHPEGLPGSAQAGAVGIYAGCIRRGDPAAIVDWLRAAPWGGKEGVVVVHNEWGPALVERLGYVAKAGA